MDKSSSLYRFSLILALLILPALQAAAQSAPTWIWYPGDYEIWLANKMQNRRTERGSFFPPFWRLDNHYVLMDFHKDVDLAAPEEIAIWAEGQYNVKIDSKLIPGYPEKVVVPAGKHRINIKVYSQEVVPSIFISGKTIVSDSSWLVTFEDKEWIDETGKVSGQSGTTWLNAGYWNFNSPDNRPSAFKLATTPASAAKVENVEGGRLVDFGKETFGFVRLHGLKGEGILKLYYGESREEALSVDHCETLDEIQIGRDSRNDSTLDLSKAFRFVFLKTEGSAAVDSISMLYEYLPVEVRGSFRCSDPLLNEIWDIGNYTMQLSTREFFIDGIKRDRWIWSGDAYQSYLMNYYLFFDNPSVTRTTLALRGKDPVTSHINTIMDYTFYWFMGIYDYYLYSGDKHFLQQCYPKMKSLMQYCLERRNKDGLMEGLSGDWVFIDWAEGLSKKGEVSFEQLLLCRSLETMAICASLTGDAEDAFYKKEAEDLRKKLFSIYWNPNLQAFVHSRVNGVPVSHVTRYTNMFSIFFGYLDENQKKGVLNSVLLNKAVPKITTPYMRFYELEALCALGEQKRVLQEIRDYWGGMLKAGATSFWEEFNPEKSGADHYAMYGRKFGKSLCHAWGASPIYLFGKYYLGVSPTSPGYKTYIIEPETGGLEWMEGKVPTPDGEVELYVSKKEIRVTGAAAGTGTLRFRSSSRPVCKEGTITQKAPGQYEMEVLPGKKYTIRYTRVER